MDKNRRLAELLGVEWHESVAPWVCACGRKDLDSWDCPEKEAENPDFTDPIAVLREMKKRKEEKFHHFISKLNAFSLDEDGDLINNAIPVDLILDTTGKLRDAAIEFLEAN